MNGCERNRPQRKSQRSCAVLIVALILIAFGAALGSLVGKFGWDMYKERKAQEAARLAHDKRLRLSAIYMIEGVDDFEAWLQAYLEEIVREIFEANGTFQERESFPDVAHPISMFEKVKEQQAHIEKQWAENVVQQLDELLEEAGVSEIRDCEYLSVDQVEKYERAEERQQEAIQKLESDTVEKLKLMGCEEADIEDARRKVYEGTINSP